MSKPKWQDAWQDAFDEGFEEGSEGEGGPKKAIAMMTETISVTIPSGIPVIISSTSSATMISETVARS